MTRQFPRLFSLLFVFTLTTFAVADEHSLLTENELDQFIHDTPAFITEVKSMGMDMDLIQLFLHPDKIDENKVLRDILIGLSWNPQRYSYIFSRVIIGGFIRDMGEFGDSKLQFLREQKEKWQQSDAPEPEKSQMITFLTESIHDLEEIVARIKAIPKTELLLMWSKRDALNDVLMGKLPIGKRKMKVQR